MQIAKFYFITFSHSTVFIPYYVLYVCIICISNVGVYGVSCRILVTVYA